MKFGFRMPSLTKGIAARSSVNAAFEILPRSRDSAGLSLETYSRLDQPTMRLA